MSTPIDLFRKQIHGIGEMAALIRDRDWSATPLGPIDQWSDEFISVVNLMLCSPVASALYCGSQLIFLYNDAYQPFTGNKHPQCLGQPARVVWKEVWDRAGGDLAAVLSTGTAKSIENVRIPILLDGRLEERYWTYTISPVYEKGEIRAVFNVSLDVTRERRAQEALRQNQDRLNAIYSTALEYIGILSPDGKILDCNRASLEFAGSTREDVVGKFLWDAPWFLYTPGAPEACRQAVAQAANCSSFRTELALNRPNGQKVILDFSITAVCNESGQLIYLIPEGRDITSLKEAEEAARSSIEALVLTQEELRWTVDLSAQIPFTADTSGEIINFSDNWLDLTGLSREELLGDGWVRVQHPDDVPLMAERRDHALRTGEPFDVEHRVRIVSGDYRWMRSRAYPRRDEAGRIVKWYGTLEDIEERKRAEAALIQSEKLAAVGRLAASIAHEINNPLEAVTNLLYLALVSDDLPEIHGFLSQAEHELGRVAAITNQTLRFHKQSTSPKAVACDDLLESVIAMNLGRIAHSRIEVRRGKHVSGAVICFDGEIRQVLANLVGNAIDAMHPQGGTLFLRNRAATHWKTGQKGVALTVADTGAGMTTVDMKRIFEPFFTTKGTNGTGLGLWISQEIVVRHQGALSVRSSQREGHSGSVFRLFLPYVPAEREPADDQPDSWVPQSLS